MKKLYAILFLLFLGNTISYAAKVDTLAIPSAKMHKTYNAAVVLPDSYAKGETRYPVLYLLHGAYGHFRDWLKSTPDKMAVKNLADQYNIIIVMPEGESFSFYIDSPSNDESQFETYIAEEVVAKIDKTYRTVSNKNGRAITGLSMGGHGALYISARNPKQFCAAGSMSGAVDIGRMLTFDSPEKISKTMEPVFGNKSGSQEMYDSHAVLNMIDKMKENKLPLIIDCGVNDFLIETNRELHRRLVYAKVPHDYTERPGAHTWDYWQNALPYHVLFFSNIFKANGVAVK